MTQWGLDTIFNPAKRHMDEEKRRLQSTREEIGDSSGGKRIDLDSGKVVIARKGTAAAPGEESVDDAGDDPAAENTAVENPAVENTATDDAVIDDAVADQPGVEDDTAAPELKRTAGD